MSSLILHLALVNLCRNELETKPLAVICSRISARAVCMHTYQTSCVLSVIPQLNEILQISKVRMKAETLSWSRGWHPILHRKVHKTLQS